MAQQAVSAQLSTLGGSTRSWSEDWLAVAAGLVVFVLALALVAGGDLLGWAASPRTWLEFGKSVRPASQAYAHLDPAVLLLITFGFVLVLMTIAAALLRINILKFAAQFTVVFWLSYLSWVLGNYAYIAHMDAPAGTTIVVNWGAPLPALQADHQLPVTRIDREVKLNSLVKEMPVIGEDFLFEIPGQHVVNVWHLVQLFFDDDRNMHPRGIESATEFILLD